MKSQRFPQITLHMVSSLDGFIAKKDGDVSWMQSTDVYEKGKVLTDQEVVDYLQAIDCYIMGSRTYAEALKLGWPYGDTPVYVWTSKDLSSKRENVTTFSGDLDSYLAHKLKPHFDNIWVVGGAQTAKTFLQKGLVDQIILTIVPILLGDGLLFFDYIGREILLHLADVTSYRDGMVELTYRIQKNRIFFS
ncbi:MAG: dihydrofolate reductase family protein [Bacteroidota bacterium]